MGGVPFLSRGGLGVAEPTRGAPDSIDKAARRATKPPQEEGPTLGPAAGASRPDGREQR